MQERMRLRCSRCEGCGQIASDEEGSPWKYWDELPSESKAAVYMGIVYPLTCEDCQGRGYIVPDEETQAALDEVIAAAMRRLDEPPPWCTNVARCVKERRCAEGC